MNDLTKGDIKGHIRRIAIPASVGFFFHTMYNVVDTYYGGLISTEALAALSLSFPVFFIIIAMSSGIGTGATALVSNALGAGKRGEARHYAAQAISFGIIISFGLTAFGLLTSPSLFRLLGASGTYLELTLAYTNMIFYGTAFFVLIQVFNASLTAIGDTRTLRNFLIGGFFLNLVLDPWFLFGGFGIPAMGLSGIALATIVIEFAGTIYVALRVEKAGFVSRTTLHQLMPEKKAFIELARQGFPASLNMMTVALGIFVITYFVGWFGAQAVAAYGTATRIEQIALLPTIGLNMATLALVGQNNGAKKFDRIRETVRKALRYGFLVILVGYTGVFFLARSLMTVFSRDAAVVTAGAEYLRIATFISFAYVILFVNVSALQGMKKPLFALWIGVYRQIIAPVAVYYFFAQWFGLSGIWWGVFLVTWSAAAITVLYERFVVKERVGKEALS